MTPVRLLYLTFGWICVVLGFVGIIFPIMPTTPFLLLAVWAFSRSSPELANKLRNHRIVGSYIRDWQDHGVIPPRAKLLAFTMMAAMSVYIAGYSAAPAWLAATLVLILALVAVYVLSRPGSAPGE